MTMPPQLAAYLHPGDWVRLLAGPILDKELRVASRRRRQYVFRTAYLAVLAAFVACVWEITVGRQTGGAWSVSHMAQVGQTVLLALVWFQFIVLVLVSVVLLSDAIGEEVRRRTLGVLLSTPITSLQVVVGKLGAGMVQVGLLVAISLPLLAVVRVFGGVPWEFVAAGLSLTLATSLMAASLSLYLSIGARPAYAVVLLSLVVLVVGLYVIPLLVTVAATGPSLSGDREITAFLAYVAPLVSLADCSSTLVSPNMRFAAGPSAYWWACGISVAASALLVGLAARKVRRVALRLMSGEGAGKAVVTGQAPGVGGPQAEAGAAVRRVTGSPVAWRELRTHLTMRPAMAGCLGCLVFGGIVLAVMWTSDGLQRDFSLHPLFLCLFVIAGTLATLVTAATGIASEKEAGTWPILLATPLTARDILAGKLVGVLRRSAPAWAFLAAYVPFFAFFRQTPPVVVLLIGLIALGMAAFAAGSGLFIGVMVRRTTTAVALNLCVAAVLWIAAPYVLATLDEGGSGEDRPLALAARVVNPLGTVALVAVGDPTTAFRTGLVYPVQVKYLAEYQLYPRSKNRSALETLGVVFFAAVAHAAVGLYLAAMAGVKLRRRIT